MDLLDPLESSVGAEDDAKALASRGLSIVDEHSMESDDEQRVVDHLSPQTLLETPPDDVQYTFRSPEGATITYGVLKVEDGSDNGSQIVASSTNFSSPGGVQQVINNLSGQVYVIGNSNEIYVSQTGTRAIAPRTATEGTTTLPTSKKRDDRRRATHNEVERRRRDKINNWIVKLSKIIPENNPGEMKGNGYYDGQSKGGILAKACEYIMELKDSQQYLEESLKQNRLHEETIDILKQRNVALEQENLKLRELLKRHGIDASSIELS